MKKSGTIMGPPPLPLPPPSTNNSSSSSSIDENPKSETHGHEHDDTEEVVAISSSNESSASSSTTTSGVTIIMMPPPPPRESNTCSATSKEEEEEAEESKQDESNHNNKHHSTIREIPYTIPSWSEPPCHPYHLEVLKDGAILNQFDVSKKGAYMFGRVDLCDFVLDHPTVSRFHAVLQFKTTGQAYLYDLGSTHGTSLNKNQIDKKVYTELHVGDVIRFGGSSRLYIFEGPPELMPPETVIKMTRKLDLRQDIQDREASLQRAKLEASYANGISWGMGEDAIEENEDDADEVTWQTYKGQLTEKQEKTREKVLKRSEKIAHMKKEIDAIRVKDIAQGGLTQGQQTQIARNEQRIAQIAEELESLEETLNESIQESLGARTGKIHGKKKGVVQDEDEYASDDDEFYDRTKKKSSIQKADDSQSVETADTLLDKKYAIMNQMEDKRSLILLEKNKLAWKTNVGTTVGDSLDAYMTDLSSQLVVDKTAQLEKELHDLQPELDRITYLLKIADPSGEAAKKRELQIQNPKPEISKITVPVVVTRPMQPKKFIVSDKSGNSCPIEQPSSDKSGNSCPIEQPSSDTIVDSSKKETDKSGTDGTESKTTPFTVIKPQWLGAVEKTEVKEPVKQQAMLDMEETDQFVDYKDRKAVLSNASDSQVKMDLGIESASGLIIRKQKQVDTTKGSNEESVEQSTSLSRGGPIKAEDAVALLLKHKRGYHAPDDEEIHEGNNNLGENQPKKDNKKTKRVLGPEKPAFLEKESDYESWVPPKGQSGDGRTSLNARYGY